MRKGIVMNRLGLAAAIMASAVGGGGSAQAALLEVVQSYPDVTFSQNWIVYDHNGVDADTGSFSIVSLGSVLNDGSGGPTQSQIYAGAGDSTADLTLSVQINNVTGAFEGGTVSIGFGNYANAPGFSWQGTITGFGFLDNGRNFDATWTLDSDQYRNMPAAFARYTDGALSGLTGGIKINNVSGFGGGNTWTSLVGRDWVSSNHDPQSAQIAPFLTGLDPVGGSSGRLEFNSTVQVDAFVPLPGAAWLFLGGLGLLMPLARRKATNQA